MTLDGTILQEDLVMANERFTPTTRGREQAVPIQEKRRLAENHLSDFAIFMGNRYLIVRPRFEEYVIAFMESGEKQFR